MPQSCHAATFPHLDLSLVGLVGDHLVQGGHDVLTEDALVSNCLLLFNRSNIFGIRADVQGKAKLVRAKAGGDQVQDLGSVALDKLRTENVKKIPYSNSHLFASSINNVGKPVADALQRILHHPLVAFKSTDEVTLSLSPGHKDPPGWRRAQLQQTGRSRIEKRKQ